MIKWYLWEVDAEHVDVIPLDDSHPYTLERVTGTNSLCDGQRSINWKPIFSILMIQLRIMSDNGQHMKEKT